MNYFKIIKPIIILLLKCIPIVICFIFLGWIAEKAGDKINKYFNIFK